MGFWEKAGKKAKEAAIVAAGTTLEAGSMIKKGAGNLYDKAAEDLKMKKEIEKINAFCNNAREKFEKDKNEFESDFQKERDQFSHILETINHRLPTYNAIITYMEQNPADVKYVAETKAYNAAFVLGRDIDTKTGESLKAAGAAGFATGLGTVGLVTAFGSASTGTALSALTGSAYIHATLAALGGGSLAAGGFGMVGGAIALGTAFLAPAAIVGGYFFNKQIRKAYDEALARKAEALEFNKEQHLFFQKLRKGLQSFRKENDIQKAVMQAGECKTWLNMLLRNLGVEEAEAMNKARYREVEVETAEEIVNLVKELRKENGWKEEKIKYQETTINKQENKIREQDAAIQKSNEFIRKLTEQLQTVQATLSENQEKSQQADKIIEELRQQVVERNPKKYKLYEENLTKQYPHLNNKALQFATSGEMLYELFEKEEFSGVDFSSVIIEYGNCVEFLLKLTLLKLRITVPMRGGSKFPPIGQIINDCVRAKKYRGNFEEGFYELLDGFNSKCRVAAAHGRGVDKEMMERARVFLFKGNAKYTKGLLKYFDDLFT